MSFNSNATHVVFDFFVFLSWGSQWLVHVSKADMFIWIIGYSEKKGKLEYAGDLHKIHNPLPLLF